MKSRTVLLVAAAIAAIVTALPITHGLSALGLIPIVFGTVPAEANSDIVRQLAAFRLIDPMGGVLRRVIAKTADYTILDPYTTTGGDASHTIFTNRGATGAVIFTLPAPVLRLTGCVYEFLGVADQNFTLVTATADTLIVVNDVAADSLAVSTSAHKIGACMRVICDGTSWIAYGQSVGDTFTVAT